MTNTPVWKTALGIATLCAILGAAQATLAGDDERCPTDSEKFARVDITIAEGAIVANPDPVMIYEDQEPKRVCWVVSGLPEGHTLHIAKKAGQPDTFPGQRRVVSPNTFANSGFPANGGSWKYRLWVRATGEEAPLFELDPEVIIKKGGGG